MKIRLPRMLEQSAANAAGYRDMAELLESRLEFLYGKEKIIMAMRIRQGATYRQIAEIVGMHPAAVARRARKISSRLLKGAFITFLRKSSCLTQEQLAIGKDYYLTGLSLPRIARNHNCTLYRVRTVLSQLASLVAQHQSPDHKGGAKDKMGGHVTADRRTAS
jgi:hypothetical protein